MAMVSYFNFIIFFSLILVLLILYNEIERLIFIFEFGFAGDGNDE